MCSVIMRLSLWATNRAKKEQNDHRSALLYSHLDGARVARQHCSTLRPGIVILSVLCPPWIGHFYFGENRTFLLWVDSKKTKLMELALPAHMNRKDATLAQPCANRTGRRTADAVQMKAPSFFFLLRALCAFAVKFRWRTERLPILRRNIESRSGMRAVRRLVGNTHRRRRLGLPAHSGSQPRRRAAVCPLRRACCHRTRYHPAAAGAHTPGRLWGSSHAGNSSRRF